MRKKILLVLLTVISLVVYGQQDYKIPAKVYLKNGKVKKGKAEINTNNVRVAGIGVKGKNFQREITLKPEEGKKVKINISEIDKIDFNVQVKALSKETKVVTYRPVIIEGDEVLARELIKGKLYSVSKLRGFSNTPDPKKEVYYIKKGSVYEKTTISKLNKEHSCSMEGKGDKEEKIITCLKS